MHSWYSIFPRNPWLSIYVWVIFCLLPFFFIFRSSSSIEIAVGISLLFLFFLSYMFSFKSKSGLVYMWLSFEMVINVVMTLLFGYIYLSLFTAFFIGNIRNPVGFFIIYGLHIAFTILAIVAGFFLEINLFLPYVHFILITVIGVVLLPFNLYNRNKREKLEDQLEDAKEKISELIILEERHRIARDLHDTLGQKLSMIGLKSDLAARLLTRDLEAAGKELHEIRQTASTALKEVRELVADMRTVKLEDELIRIRQILKAAEMDCTIEGNPVFTKIPTIAENVLSMCLKEAVTNVVKHSFGTACHITFAQLPNEYLITVEDDGIGIPGRGETSPGSGLKGMRERLEFINGSLHIEGGAGTKLYIRVPAVLKQIVEVD
ncbi:two-component sensor histidine kinase [Bacillus sp. OxB-1]|uniref:sensor histidine kinase n=1 Tax=Bacillus sp. (strain OxB-1) TaxID=98228 RepID=UPI000581DF1B|nr:sensor histidine kinase [Bacillus sp. OxB-1]BAQ09251.1 two-component sensor histidine kinase [Bacillus sp. OxB-1]